MKRLFILTSLILSVLILASLSTPGFLNPAATTGAPAGTTVAGCIQADIQKLVDSVSEANITALLKELVQDDAKPKPNEAVTRAVGTAGNTAKTTWIQQTMTGYGYQPALQPDGQSGNNVVSTIAGTDPNSVYVLSAHMDTTSEDSSNLAPGAEDDGSGTVAIMEAGRVLKSFPAQCLVEPHYPVKSSEKLAKMSSNKETFTT